MNFKILGNAVRFYQDKIKKELSTYFTDLY